MGMGTGLIGALVVDNIVVRFVKTFVVLVSELGGVVEISKVLVTPNESSTINLADRTAIDATIPNFFLISSILGFIEVFFFTAMHFSVLIN